MISSTRSRNADPPAPLQSMNDHTVPLRLEPPAKSPKVARRHPLSVALPLSGCGTRAPWLSFFSIARMEPRSSHSQFPDQGHRSIYDYATTIQTRGQDRSGPSLPKANGARLVPTL